MKKKLMRKGRMMFDLERSALERVGEGEGEEEGEEEEEGEKRERERERQRERR